MIRAIVTDIEGTTSSISFVKDVLFPYARKHLPDFIRQHRQEPAVAALLDAARQIAGLDEAEEAALINKFIEWIDSDQKITPLKSLQGLIWQDGYDQGAFHGHIYDDALRQLQTWHRQGYALYVYSSGSVYAQKLLFSHTEQGDLTPLFSGFFDTHVGGKKEAASYRHIAEHIDLPGEQILFLSDICEELDAARQAGWQTCWLVREQSVDPQATHRQVADFDAIAV